MNKQDKNKIKEWSGNVAKKKKKKRSEYAGGPAIIKWYLDILEKEISDVKKKNKNAKVLILGATPETRDLVKKYGLDLTIIDQNREMIEKMTSIMKEKGRENIVIGNWLSMPFKENTFDLVLGDGVSNNISYGETNAFFKEINRVLKKDGIMLLREAALNDTIKYSTEEIIRGYRKDNNYPRMWLKFYLFSDCSFRDQKENYFDMGKTYENIENKKELFRTDEFEKIMSWRGNIKHTIIEEKELSKMIVDVFKNVEMISKKSKEDIILKLFKFFKSKKQ